MVKFPRLQSFIDKTAIQSWSWYHFIFLFGVIPSIILSIPVSGLSEILKLDICNPGIIQLYTTNFVHGLLPHLTENLVLYIIAMTGVLFMEKNRARFHKMMLFLFGILPFLGSLAFIYYFDVACTIKPSLFSYGFSAITLGAVGYCNYLLLLSTLPILFRNVENKWLKKDFSGYYDSFYIIVIINFIILFAIDIVGFAAGNFSLTKNMSISNGFVHAFGFILGVFVPMTIEIFKEEKLDNFHKTFVIHFCGMVFWVIMLLSFQYSLFR